MPARRTCPCTASGQRPMRARARARPAQCPTRRSRRRRCWRLRCVGLSVCQPSCAVDPEQTTCKILGHCSFAPCIEQFFHLRHLTKALNILCCTAQKKRGSMVRKQMQTACVYWVGTRTAYFFQVQPCPLSAGQVNNACNEATCCYSHFIQPGNAQHLDKAAVPPKRSSKR